MKFKIIPLEERIVLDAAGVSDIVDSYHFEHQLDANASKDGIATPSDIIADSHDSLMVDHTGAGASANRVIVLSSHVKDADILAKASLDNTKIILYDPSSTSLNDLSNKITAALNGTKADNITFVNDGNASGFKLTDNTSVSLDSLNKDQSLQTFWQNIGQLMKADGQVDLLVANLSSMQANKTLINELGSLVGGHEKSVHFASTQDLLNHSDTNDSFNLSSLKSWSDNLASTADNSTGTNPLHILLVASDVSDSAVLAQAAASNVKVIYYDSEHTTLQQLSDKISATLNGTKADSIAFANEGSGDSIRLTSDITMTSDSLRSNLALQNFWHNVGSMVKDGGRIDLLACYTASTAGGKTLVSELDTFVDSEAHDVSVAASIDRTANAAQSGNWTLEIGNIDARSIYFNSNLLNNWSGAMDLTGGGVIMLPPVLGGPGLGTTVTFQDDHYSLPDPVSTPTLHVSAESGIQANDSSNVSSDAGSFLPPFRIVSGPSHGTLSLGSDGSFDYTPTPGFKGTDVFTYTYEPVKLTRPGDPPPPPPVTAIVSINVGYEVQDIAPGSANSNPRDFVQIGNKIFFVATTAANGTELWVRDLSTNSISIVADRQTGTVGGVGGVGGTPVDLLLGTILNGSSIDKTPSSSPTNLTAVNGILYFTATDSSGTELWKTDGTANGTLMVKDITPGSGSTAFETLYNANGTLYFVVNGNQLWKSTGDSAGTISVKQFAAGSHITSFANQGGVLYYSATDGTVDTIGLNNFQVPRVTLWRTDIASNATEAVVKQPGLFGSNPIPYFVDNIISYNNTLYFTAYVPVIDGATGSVSIASSFWKANGIPQGTAGSSYGLVYQTISTDRFTFDNVTQHNGSIFFTGIASDTHRASLFVSNGTTTTILKDFYNNGFGAMSLTSTSSGILYFVAQDSATTAGIWRSDGSVGGTVLLKDFSYNLSSEIFPPANLVVSGNSVYFTANDGISGTELWKTDGTTAGTVLIDLYPGSGSSNPTNLHIAGNKLSFAADNGLGQGTELYSIVANQPPTFNLNDPFINANEDPGPQTVGNWITGISAGAGETGNVTFTITSSNPNFFSSAPTLNIHGTTADILYTLASNVTGNNEVTITISDGTSTFSRILTWRVTNVNDAPSGADKTITILEDNSYTITVNDFGFSDVKDNPSNSFVIVGIDSLPTNGTLLFDGVALTQTRNFSVAEIMAGRLVFKPADNANGSGYASFKFKVQDDGGDWGGGLNTSLVANTLTFNVTAVNDAPTFNLNDPYINAGEDATPQVVGNWITGISAGPGETGNVTFTVTSSRPDFFSSGPTLNVHGTTADVIYTLAPNVLGNNEVTITISDGTLTFSRILTWRVGNTNNDPPMGTDTTKTILEDSTYVINASDFGFSDPTDFNPTTGSGSNSLLAVKITTLPTNGTLTNNGVAVTAGQFISLADINNGKLTFKPAVNTNGNNLANFTFQVQDDGGTGNGGVDLDPTPNTFTFNVTPVNDAPSGATAFKNILEDTSYTFALRDFGFSDSADGNTLMDVKITTLPTNGSLTNNGVAVTAGQFISQADINGGKLIFTPASNVNGSNAASFTFQVRDNGGTANGGVDLDGSPNTFRFDITFVSDPPSGTDITKDISKGTSYTLTVNDFLLGFSDVENHSFVDVKITTLPTNGTLTFNGVAVTAGQFFSIANIITNQLIFTPSSNEVGAPYSSFTFQVRDNGSTANGGINLDPTPNTFTFNVINTNNAPIGESKSVSTSEDTILNGSLNFSDVEGDNLAATVLQGTAHGTLVLNNDGTFTYTPAANYNGSDSFTYKLNDGTDDSAIYTVTINVAAVNDAPVGESKTVSTNEDTTLNESLNFADAEGNNLTATVLQGTAHGTLVLNNDGTFTYTPAANYNGSDSFTYKLNDGTADSTIYTININVNSVNDVPVGESKAVSTNEDTIINGSLNFSDIEGDNLSAVITQNTAHGTLVLNNDGTFTYTPAANYNGSDSFSYKLNDGTSDSAIYTVTINVASVNDAPSGINSTKTILEDTPYTFTSSDFGFSDSSDSPQNSLLAVKIATLPTNGTLRNNGVLVTTGQFISIADINSGKLIFTPNANAYGSNHASFTFQVQDNGGTANGGIDLDASPNTITFSVTSVPDAPSGTDITKTILEDGSYTITAADFGFSDANDNPSPQSFTAVTITAISPGGSLRNNGVLVTAGQSISIADINAGKLIFTPNANINGTDAARFTFQVQDSTIIILGPNLDPTPNTFSFNITPVNDAPTGSSNTKTILEDTPYTITASDFGFSDPTDNQANSLAAVKITTIPTNGILTNNGVAVTAGQFISIADINSGKLIFTPASNANGGAYANFTFQVQDNGGTANGGIDLSPTFNVFLFNVVSINDAPSGTDITKTIAEDTNYSFAASDFGFSDLNDNPANSLSAVKITNLPTNGVLTNNGVAVTAGQFISIADINSGKLIFTPASNANGAGYANFTFQVQDNGSTLGGGVNLDSTPNTFTFNVTPVNDVPVGESKTVSTNEDTALNGSLNLSDIEGDSLTATVVQGTAHGSLILNNDGTFTYTPAANYNGSDSFTYKLNDGTDDSAIYTVTINVAAVNDAPVGESKTVSTNEDTALNGSLNLSDIEGDSLTATVLQGTAHGTLVLNNDGTFTYTLAANYNGSDSFTYKLNDGTDDSAIYTVTINIAAVNDAPVGENKTVSTNEDTALNGSLNLSDIEGDSLTATVVQGTAHGSLILNNDGTFTYTPAANYNGSDSFTYKLNDGTDDSAIYTVTINVAAVNDAPVGESKTVSTNEDTALNGSLNLSDIEGNNLTATVLQGTAHGTLVLNNDGTFTYTPAANYNGSDSFTYKLNDGTDDSAIYTVTINITAVNDAPVGENKTVSTNEDTALNGSLNLSDIEGDSLTATVLQGTAHGTLVLNNDGTFTYTPAANYNGSDSFTYKLNDGTDDSAIYTVTINIAAVNDAPVGESKTVSTNEDTTLNGSLNLSDIEGNNLTATVLQGTAHGSLILNNDGTFTYTPAANYNGSDSFTYKLNDGTDDSAIYTVTINITAVNDAPVGENKTVSTNEDTALNGSLNLSDIEGDSLTATVLQGTAHGTLVLNNDGTFTYTPAANYNGSDSFTYKLNDGTDDSAIYTVTINIAAVNDAPVGESKTVSTNEDTTLNGSLNLSDIEGNNLTATVLQGTAHGSLILNNDGTFTYTPAANYNGSDSFTYKLNDGTDDSAIYTVTINIAAVNDALVGENKTVSTNEDTALNGSLNLSDIEGNNLTATVLQGTAHGTLVLNNDGTFTYTPAPNYNGSDSFTYKLNDGTDDSAIYTVTINVAAVNDAPVGENKTVSTNEDTALNGSLNLSDIESDSLTATVLQGTAHGTLVLNNDGTFTYTPAANYNGSDSFTYKLNDGTDDSAIYTVTINIAAVNDAPVGENKTVSTNEDTILNGSLNLSDIEGDSLTATVVQGTAHGSLILNNDGTFTYTPAPNYNGSDSFTYKLNDGTDDSVIYTITINVAAVNDAPVGESKTVSTNEDTILNGSLNLSDIESDSLTATVLQGTAHGTLVLNNDGTFTYTPAANYNGSDSFTYKLNDGTDDSAIYTVTINIAAVNDAPVGENKTVSTNEDTILNGSLNLSDIEGNNLTATVLQGTAHGTLVLNNDGTFTYTPAPNYNGSDSFTYKLNDGTNDSAIYTVTINVAAVNDAPVAVNDSVTTAEDTAIIINVLGNDSDIDGTTPTIASFSQGAHGSVTLVAGKLVYTPAANYNGTDSITYTITDGSLTSTATVNINITPVNDAPVAVNDSVITAEDNAIIINVLGNDSDVDGTTPTIASFSQGAHGSVTLVAGKLVYTPAANYNGTDSITYTITDGSLTSTATVNINITPVNDAPVAANDAYSVNQGSTLNITAPGVIANDNDVDGNTLLGSIISGPSHGSITFNANGSFNYTPNSNYSGTDFFTYKVNDGSLDSNIATVTLTVNPVNHAPVANNDSYNDFYNTGGSTKIIINALNGVLTNDTDQDAGTTLTAQLMSGPSHGTLQLNADGSFSYTANAGYSGIDSFTYKAKDGELLSNAATVNIVVDAKPQLRLGGASFRIYTENDDPLILSTAAQISDADSVNFGGAKLIINISGNATNTDILSIIETNNINISGNSIYENGVLIGSFTGGNNMSPLIITFNSNTLAQDVREVVRHIGFSNSSNMPSTLDRTVSFTLQDAQGAQSDIQTKLVKVNAVNDGAQVGVQDNTISVSRNIQTNIGISSMAGLSLSDIDGTSNSIYAMTLQVNKGTLNFTSLSGIDGLLFLDRPDADGLSTIVFAGTRDQINLALSRLTYTSRYNFTGQDKLMITAMDTGLSVGNSISSIFQYTSGYFLLDKETIFITVS